MLCLACRSLDSVTTSQDCCPLLHIWGKAGSLRGRKGEEERKGEREHFQNQDLKLKLVKILETLTFISTMYFQVIIEEEWRRVINEVQEICCLEHSCWQFWEELGTLKGREVQFYKRFKISQEITQAQRRKARAKRISYYEFASTDRQLSGVSHK